MDFIVGLPRSVEGNNTIWVVVDRLTKMARYPKPAEDKGMTTLHTFNEKEYEGERLLIGRFLRTMMPDASWTKEEALHI